jgi:glycine betaine/proline transport system ATP-binding protein
MRIACHEVCKVFGSDSSEAITQMESMTKSELMAKTGQVVAVKNVSFEVDEGETFVIMGLSGSGKSTLVRCLSRLIEPTSGKIEVDGDDVAKMSPKELIQLRRKKMSMVFQYFGLFPHRNVLDNITYGLEIQGVNRKDRAAKGEEILCLIGLEGWGYNYPKELSGGMQQRVGLARALAVDPEIMLFDEPFSALDPLIRRDMQDELIQLRKVVKKAMIFITHDFMEAIRLADTMAIMRDGEFVQVGTPEDLVLNPCNDYVRDFTEEVPSQKILSAASIMKSCDVILDDSQTVGTIRDKINSRNTDIAFINDSSGEFVGTVSMSNLEQSGAKSSMSIKDFIDKSSTTYQSTVKMEELIPVAAEKDVKIPIMSPDNRLLGYVDRVTIMSSLTNKSKKLDGINNPEA